MNIDLSNYGNFTRDEYAIGTTSKNSYYPLYSLLDNNRIGRNQFMYYKPSIVTLSAISRYNELFETLRSKMYFSRFNFISNDENHFILVMKGYIANHLQQPLLMIGINTFEHGLSIYDSDEKSEETKAKLKVFVATELLTNDIYTNIWRKIDRDFIQLCYEDGIAVEFCTIETIEKTFFSNEFVVEYNNLTELNNHLKNDVADLLFRRFPTYTYDDTLDLNSEVVTAESIVYTEGNNREASLIPTDMVVDFVKRYYEIHGSLPERCYFRNNGNVIFTFESGINHMFAPDDIRCFVQEATPYHVPNPTSLDNETVTRYVPDVPSRLQVDTNALESSIVDIICSDIPITEEEIRAIVFHYQGVRSDGVRMVYTNDDENLHILYGDYTSVTFTEEQYEALLREELGFRNESVSVAASESDVEDEEIRVLDDEFVLVDDTDEDAEASDEEVLDENEPQQDVEDISW